VGQPIEKAAIYSVSNNSKVKALVKLSTLKKHFLECNPSLFVSFYKWLKKRPQKKQARQLEQLRPRPNHA